MEYKCAEGYLVIMGHSLLINQVQKAIKTAEVKIINFRANILNLEKKRKVLHLKIKLNQSCLDMREEIFNLAVNQLLDENPDMIEDDIRFLNEEDFSSSDLLSKISEFLEVSKSIIAASDNIDNEVRGIQLANSELNNARAVLDLLVKKRDGQF